MSSRGPFQGGGGAGGPRGPSALAQAKLSDFDLEADLGAGTTSKVYRARHRSSQRLVAVKIIEPSQSGREMRERFAREALLLASVTSRYVGAILGFGFELGQPFLVLELLEGETLDAKLRRDGPVALDVALRWTEQLLLGVRDVHDRQIVHRDVKPSNLFLHREAALSSSGGRAPADAQDLAVVKLIDFGVARLREISGEGPDLTSTGHLIGSMGYMSPEQFRDAKSVGFVSDLYAVGVCIFRMLTGRLPFVSRSLEAVIRMKAEKAAPLVSSMPGMPRDPMLDWFVAKAMAADPRVRFQSAREMLEEWSLVCGSLDATLQEDVATEVSRGRFDAAGMPGFDPASSASPVDTSRTDGVPTVRLPPEIDLHDMPTRSDPGLREIIARERELQRRRKR